MYGLRITFVLLLLMYRNCSDECLKNAKSLLEDAKILLKRKRYGSAQSLSITAMEEVGKAIILEFVDLGIIEKEKAKNMITNHPPKRKIMLGMEKGKLLPDQSKRRSGDYLDKDNFEGKLKLIGEQLQKEMDDFNKRRNILFVEVNIDKGEVKSSPKDCNETDSMTVFRKSTDYLTFGEILCKRLRNNQECEGYTNNFGITQDAVDFFFNFRNDRETLDKTLSISYDEA
jgi:AbiV family abortive infection protein